VSIATSCRPPRVRRRCKRLPRRLPRPNRQLLRRRRRRPRAHRGVPMSGSTRCCTASGRRDTIPRIRRSHRATDGRCGGKGTISALPVPYQRRSRPGARIADLCGPGRGHRQHSRGALRSAEVGHRPGNRRCGSPSASPSTSASWRISSLSAAVAEGPVKQHRWNIVAAQATSMFHRCRWFPGGPSPPLMAGAPVTQVALWHTAITGSRAEPCGGWMPARWGSCGDGRLALRAAVPRWDHHRRWPQGAARRAAPCDAGGEVSVP
jgi:hypothetical protein